MPLQATSGAASYDAFGGGVPVVPAYIEEVFSTYLYTGNSTSQTITNGIDLSGKGGMTWLKMRSPGSGFPSTQDHALFQTAAPDGSDEYLIPNSNSESFYRPTNGIDFTSSGFTIDAASYFGGSGDQSTSNFASWSFRKQAKFFDVVYFVGTGSARTVPHSLGSVPGCVIVKSNSTGNSANYDWAVYHQSLGNTKNLRLNTTAAQATATAVWNNTTPTATEFTVGTSTLTNQSGVGYVALVFAHDAGGFGLTGTDNVISCGSYTEPASGFTDINLGYEVQWLLTKSTTTGDWVLTDIMQGMSETSISYLKPNSSAATTSFSGSYLVPTATGFRAYSGFYGSGTNLIYIAIRRGPMKVPTSGTSVYQAATGGSSGSATTPNFTSGFPVDFAFWRRPDTSSDWPSGSRLAGAQTMSLNLTDAESANSNYKFDYQTGWYGGSLSSLFYSWMFRRAPSFFDVVCYTGNDTLRTINHNLGVAPEMMIIKCRDSALDWAVYHTGIGNTKYIFLNSTAASVTASSYWNNTSPTASVFTINTTNKVNSAPSPYVAYLFATCAGVSKVGSYTGTATTKQIDCGFTGGARFVLIKRTDSTGDWYVWDTARGIVSGNDSYLLLNSTAAEVTNTDYIDTYSAGFEISSTAPAAINASGGSFIFFAVA